MTDRLKCMFDSNIFDEFIDCLDLVERIVGCVDVYVTHVQPNENDCAPPPTKASLRQVRDALGVSVVSTESTVWGVSKWNQKWTKPDNLIARIRGPVFPDSGKPYVNKTRDALIAETAIKNDFVLVTQDGDLRKKVKSLGGRGMSWEQLLEHCGKEPTDAQ